MVDVVYEFKLKRGACKRCLCRTEMDRIELMGNEQELKTWGRETYKSRGAVLDYRCPNTVFKACKEGIGGSLVSRDRQ
jgi:hypothetical protein